MEQQNHRRHNQQQHGGAPPFLDPILEYYNALPPISRAWFTLSLLTTGLHTLEIFPSNKLIFLWHRVQPPHYELWRILTSFSWAGPGTLVDFHVLILLYSMTVTVPSYEKDPHDAAQIEVPRQDGNLRDQILRRWIRRRPRHRQSDCLFAFLCCSVLILITYLMITETSVLNVLSNYIDLPNLLLPCLLARYYIQ